MITTWCLPYMEVGVFYLMAFHNSVFILFWHATFICLDITLTSLLLLLLLLFKYDLYYYYYYYYLWQVLCVGPTVFKKSLNYNTGMQIVFNNKKCTTNNDYSVICFENSSHTSTNFKCILCYTLCLILCRRMCHLYMCCPL